MTILSTIMGVESGGGHNILQGNIGDVNNQAALTGGSYQLAQGYFQITGPTWAQFGGNQYAATPLQATYAQQLAVAQNIPVSRWGPDTQNALQAAGYSPSRGQTLGQLMSANGETGTETTAADGSSLSGSGTVLADGAPDTSSGLAAGSNAGVTANSDPLGSSVTQNPSGTSSTTTAPPQGTQIQTALQPEEQGFITSTVTGIENAFGGMTSTILKSAQTAVGTLFGGLENWFVRFGLIALGILIIVVALIVLLWDHGGEKFANQAVRIAAI